MAIWHSILWMYRLAGSSNISFAFIIMAFVKCFPLWLRWRRRSRQRGVI